MKTPERTYFVSGVCCSTEEVVMRKQLDARVGKDRYSFNPVTSELRVAESVDANTVISTLRLAGFNGRSRNELEREQTFWERHGQAITTGVAALLALAGIVLEQVSLAPVLSRIMLLAAIAVGGWRVFLKAYISVKTRSLDMNFLMSVAVIGALAIDKWSEGAAVIVLFSVSLMLESYSAARTRRAIQSLMALSPTEACVLKNGIETVVPAREVAPGDIVIIRPGEKVPLDGIVTEGRSHVDQSAITGESTPVAKSQGATVFAGSINANGMLQVRVTAQYEETTLARIVHLVEDAQQQRAPVQLFVDRFARIYSPALLVLAVLVAIVPPLFMGQPFSEWIYRALVLLVIACPCALVISTPVTIVSAVTNATRRGVLIKGGKHLETLSQVKAIAFDKTGTLSEGRPRVTDVILLNSLTRDQVLKIIAAMEQYSEHHVAAAVLSEAARHSIEFSDLRVEGFEALPGRGIRGEINGANYLLGNHELIEEMGQCSSKTEEVLEVLTQQGRTAIILGNAIEPLAVIGIADAAREQSKDVLAELDRIGIKHIVMLTGDHEISAQHLAGKVGIENVSANLLPADKVKVVEELKRRHGTVAMVGDGVNDAPALAAASVGIAMGVNGTDAALETADVVLMSDDLGKLPFLFGLSRETMKIIRQNIAIALSLKLIFLFLTVTGIATLWMAVLADDGAALIVILNSLRALSFSEKA
ncbi:MAG: heavy metal translocating P-type ATPase [Bacteroidota bacterium]